MAPSPRVAACGFLSAVGRFVVAVTPECLFEKLLNLFLQFISNEAILPFPWSLNSDVEDHPWVELALLAISTAA